MALESSALESGDTRLNKFISETGIVSRREADRLIEEGAVKVNGRKAKMGMRVNASDQVTVRGKPLLAKPRPVYLIYNKPVGITCTTDPEVPENIVDAVNYPQRIFPIGRLDKPSQGLILLTNDGDIVNKILRAGNAHEKEYQVRVDRPIGTDFIERMGAGIPILGTVTQPCKVRQTGSNSFTIVLTQGLNRQIRRMTEHLGVEVTHLKRLRLMNIQLGRLATGQWRELSPGEMITLEGMLGDSSKTEDASRSKRQSKNKSESKSKSKGKSESKSKSESKTTTQSELTPVKKAAGKPRFSNKPKPSKKRGTLGKPSSSAKKTAYKGAGKSRLARRSPRGRS